MSASEGQSASQVRQITGAEVDERLSALVGNAAAVAAVAAAVEGTLGPRGLNCMLVDKFGDVTITNDGVTVLEKMDVSHPAARLLIQVARAQDREVGDGTTTAAVLASAFIKAGVERIRQGVPVAKVLEGLALGVKLAREAMQGATQALAGTQDPLLRQVALIAGRQDETAADLALAAAKAVPTEKLLCDPTFRLGAHVLAKEGAQNQVILGLVIAGEPVNRQMPARLAPARIVLLDDALEPEAIGEEALGTDAGFQRYVQLQDAFSQDLGRLVASGANVVFVRKAVAAQAEEALGEAGAMVVRRVLARDLARIAAHTGARVMKRGSLGRSIEEIKAALGRAEAVEHDERLGHIRITGGCGEPAATILVGAATPEVREERQRIVEDATSAVQAALRGGVLPGGGAAEIAAMRAVQDARRQAAGMAGHGMDCVIEALRRPMAQIVANAGFNPLEKVEAAAARQTAEGSAAFGVNCDTGEVQDMTAAGVLDPAPVKLQALAAAAEAAEAILRINIVIRKKEERPAPSQQ